MAWESKPICRNCLAAHYHDKPIDPAISDVKPHFDGDTQPAMCYRCESPIFGGVAYWRVEVDRPPSEN